MGSDDTSSEQRPGALPPTYFTIAVALMATSHYAFPVAQIVGFPHRLLGMLPLLAGVAIGFWGWKTFRAAGTTIIPFQRSTHLVSDGPFRFSRNPIYSGMVIILLGIAIGFGSLGPFVLIPLFASTIQRRFIIPEEKMLAATFGAEYEEYRSQVKRWL